MRAFENTSLSISERVEDILQRMTLLQKTAQMCLLDGRKTAESWLESPIAGGFFHLKGNDILKAQSKALEQEPPIPLLIAIDAVHGNCFHDQGAVFPSQLAMAASFDKNLVRNIAKITAAQVRTTGIHLNFSPVLCVGRDIRWGRIGETFGEDPYLISVLGAQMIKGYQGDNVSGIESVAACAKHFIAYGETVGGRDSTDADISERKMRTLFTPPFMAAIDHSLASIMVSYNSINGTPASANEPLLKSLLREELGFKGLVITDYDNLGSLVSKQRVVDNLKDAARLCLQAGNDFIMASPSFKDHAVELVQQQLVDESLIDDACRRILTLKFQLGLFDSSEPSFIANGHSNSLYIESTLEAAQKSCVLLKNTNNLLPLDPTRKLNIVLLGENSDNVFSQLGDWSFSCDPIEEQKKSTLHHAKTVTLKKALIDSNEVAWNIKYERAYDVVDGKTLFNAEIEKVLENADLIILALGDTLEIIGEGRDRAKMDLPENQKQLLLMAKATGLPIVAVLINGKPIAEPMLYELPDAVLETWNSGQQGGVAIRNILSGKFNPSGKLPISIPVHVGQQPVAYHDTPGWHSKSYVDLPREAQFSFGYGMSYSSFDYSNLMASQTVLMKDDLCTLSVKVKNTSLVPGFETVQLYVNDLISSVLTPELELRGFEKLWFDAGETKMVSFELVKADFELVNSKNERKIEPGDFEFLVGSSSRRGDLLSLVIKVAESW